MNRIVKYFFIAVFTFLTKAGILAEESKDPVTVLFVSSLSCPHCAQRSDEIKSLLEAYEKDGKIKAIWVDYPNDLATLVATKISRSFGSERHYEICKALQKRQKEWHNENWRTQLLNITKELELDQKIVNECFESDTDIEREIVDAMNNIIKKYHLQFVPAFIVGGKEVADADKESLEKALKKLEQGSNKEIKLTTPQQRIRGHSAGHD